MRDDLAKAYEMLLKRREKEIPTLQKSSYNSPRFLYIVSSCPVMDGEKLDITVPIFLLKKGFNIPKYIPEFIKQKIQKKLNEKGIDFDILKVNNENFDDFLQNFRDFEIPIGEEGTLRIYCR